MVPWFQRDEPISIAVGSAKVITISLLQRGQRANDSLETSTPAPGDTFPLTKPHLTHLPEAPPGA